MTDSASAKPLISLRNASKTYRTSDVRTTALRDVSLDVEEGDFVAIVGPSGSGKSTLLNVVGLLTGLDGGSYGFAGTPVSDLPERDRSKLRAQQIGFIFQSFQLVDVLTVERNVALSMKYMVKDRGEIRARVRETLDQLGVGHRAGHYPSQLSGGQQQRVAIARAIANRPRLLLADEPTGNLDTSTGEEVMRVLRDLNEQGTTIAVVTHSPDIAAQARRRITIQDGVVLHAV
ncbi:MAG TPA: ABC transporter ATP-binding protein [Allosphingosinicella sp.]|nr:ABC transporter ATP-binding protein [Allosphingosinicella sp.]